MTEEPETREAQARPTKRLLVDVLTKDIDLAAAILDLIDNSVDSARRHSTDASLDGRSITVTFTKSHFAITDNCGGIPLSDAERRAFCFGPDDDDPPDPFSTGQFGVGMKRALFKLGKAFVVKSTTEEESFTVRVNVAKWLKDSRWTFDLEDIQEGLSTPDGQRGTLIEIDPLLKPIGKELSRTTVVNELKWQATQRHQKSLARGLSITINGDALSIEDPKVVADDTLMPTVSKSSLNGSGEPVQVDIVCGVVPGKPRDAGWSVFLNDRAVLLADKSATTGWGEKDEGRIPRFHNQYGRFRGFAFLSCEDTTRLPWNTTKTGLDHDDDIYQSIRSMMVEIADPVIDFLDAIKKEKGEGDDEYGILRESVDDGQLQSVFNLAAGPESPWAAPEAVPSPEPPETTRVYTDQPVPRVDKAKASLGVSTNVELGDALFDYYADREM